MLKTARDKINYNNYKLGFEVKQAWYPVNSVIGQFHRDAKRDILGYQPTFHSKCMHFGR